MKNNFIKTFLFTTITLIFIFVGLILSVDPYDKFGINLFKLKTKAVSNSLENKYYMFQNSKKEYKAFILGSSGAHRYRTEDMEELTGLKTFNYSIQHAVIDDYFAIVKHIVERAKNPKLIFIQIDFEALNKFEEVDSRLYRSPLNIYLNGSQSNYFKTSSLNSYFTLDALIDSFKVLSLNYFGEIRHEYLQDGNYKKEERVQGEIKINQFESSPFEISKKRIDYIDEINEITKLKDIKLIVLSAPRSYEHMKRIMDDKELQKSYIKFQETLHEKFKLVYDFNNLSFLKEYNTTEFFNDSNHPTPKFSKLLLEKILKN